MNCNDTAPPPGTEAEPDKPSEPVPAVSGSIINAASRPAVDAPVLSPGRVTTMSMRPLFSSTWLLNAGVMPPWRMNVPSCTLRMRISAGLYVIDNVNVDRRVALAIEIGTVYGPLPTRISLGGLNEIRAGAAIGSACVGAGVAGGVAGAAAGDDAAGAGGSAGGEKTCTLLGGETGAVCGAGTIPGIGELVGGTTGRCVLPVGNTGAAAGCVAVFTGAAAGVAGDVPAGTAGAEGACAADGSGSAEPIVAGGPVSDMLLCVPM